MIKAFFTEKQSPTAESVKELLRVLLFGFLSLLVTEVSVFLETSQSQAIWAVLLLAGLRWLDKWLHASGHLDKGITRF